jgi:tetratricopeptide (TPR) repeat protein/transcriptional regulator with XRE-family HTH domain
MDTVQPRAFGTLLRRLRRAAGLTQEELAERAGVSVRSIGDLERGSGWTPRRDTVTLLAEALGLSPEEHAALAEAARELRVSAPAAPARPDATTPLLVGRQRELALLERHLAGQGPPLLLLAGEPGIGKTRLLAEAVHRGAVAGWSVLLGGCTRSGGQLPYTPLLQALQRQMRGHSTAQRWSALRGCAWLVRLLPELADGPIEPLPAWTVPPDQERRLMFDAVARFLTNMAGPSGTLLVLDDLQWAGADALDLLVALLRAHTDTPVRVLGAYRETEVRPVDPLAATLADLAQAELATHRRLDPLTQAEAHALLASLLEHAATPVLERIVQRTGGVPFFVVSYARDLQSAGQETSRVESLPWDLGQSIRRRVQALPAGARELLGVAAVAGRIVPRVVLLAVAEQPEPAVLTGLDGACHAQLLEETGADAYRFVHDVIREVVEADLGAARRRVLHRRIAAALEQQAGEPPVEALAYHWVRSGDREQAVTYLEQAGDRALAQHAHVAAEGYFQDLVDHLESLGRVQAAARAREKLGVALSTQARDEEALAVLERAAVTYRALGELEGEGRIAAQTGHLHIDLGTPEQGLRLVQPLVARLAPLGPSPVLATLHMALAALFWHCGGFTEQLAAAEQAAAVARALGDTRLLAAAHGARGSALETMGRIPEGLRALQEALRLAESAGELGSPSDLEMLIHAANASGYSGQFADAMRYLDRAVHAAERLADPRYIAWILFQRAGTRREVGDWEAARTDLERAVAMHRQLGMSSRSAWALTGLGYLHQWEGAWEEANREIEEALAIAARSGDALLLLMSHGLLAEIEICQGQPAAARARLLPLLEHRDMDRQLLHFVVPHLARAHLELGETSDAETLIMQIVAYARGAGELLLLAKVLWLQALVAGRQGRWEEATAAVEEGISLTRSMPFPYMEARTLQVYGDLHRQKGEPKQAHERLAAALAIFRRLGARRDAAHLEQALAALLARVEAVPDPPSLPAWRTEAHDPTGTRRARADRQAWALDRLRTAGPLSPGAYASALGVSVDTALRDLQQLVEQGLVQAAGRTKNRRYTLAGDTARPAIRRTGL